MLNDAVESIELQPRQPWTEPEMRQLSVQETAFQPGPGNDGEPSYPDCSYS